MDHRDDAYIEPTVEVSGSGLGDGLQDVIICVSGCARPNASPSQE
jgi:hypothetical protein